MHSNTLFIMPWRTSFKTRVKWNANSLVWDLNLASWVHLFIMVTNCTLVGCSTYFSETNCHTKTREPNLLYYFFHFLGLYSYILSDKYSKITGDNVNCSFYFWLPLVILFLSKDTYKSAEVWCWSFILQFWFWI